MYPTHLVTHDICRDVLLWSLLAGSAHSKIHSRSHLLNLNSRQLLPTPLRPNQIDSQMHFRLDLLPIHSIPRTNADHILQSLYINLIRGLALEEIRKERLDQSILIRNRALKRRPTEQQHRLQSHRTLLVLKLRQRPERLSLQIQLQHIQNLVPKRPHKGNRMWTFLATRSKD